MDRTKWTWNPIQNGLTTGDFKSATSHTPFYKYPHPLSHSQNQNLFLHKASTSGIVKHKHALSALQVVKISLALTLL